MKDNFTISSKKIIYSITPYRIFTFFIYVFLMILIPAGAWLAGVMSNWLLLGDFLTVGSLIVFVVSRYPVQIKIVGNQKIEFLYPFSRKILTLGSIRSVSWESSIVTITHSEGAIRMPNEGWGTHKLAKSLQEKNPQIQLKGFGEQKMKLSSYLTVIFIWFSLFTFFPVNAGSVNRDSPQNPVVKRVENKPGGAFEFLREPLKEAGLKLKDGSPDQKDLDGDGEAEFLGYAESDLKFGDYYVPAFYIAGKVSGKYKVLYKLLLGDAHFFDETFVDFDNDGIKDFYFRYGDSDYDYGYTLLWIKKDEIREIYQKDDPDYFYLEDLDENGFYEIIQMKGPYAGPNSDGMIRDWTWKDVYRWDSKKKKFLVANEHFPEFYKKLRLRYQQILAQIEGKDVPGHHWPTYRESFLELKAQIENDFLVRIKKVLGEGRE